MPHFNNTVYQTSASLPTSLHEGSETHAPVLPSLIFPNNRSMLLRDAPLNELVYLLLDFDGCATSMFPLAAIPKRYFTMANLTCAASPCDKQLLVEALNLAARQDQGSLELLKREISAYQEKMLEIQKRRSELERDFRQVGESISVNASRYDHLLQRDNRKLILEPGEKDVDFIRDYSSQQAMLQGKLAMQQKLIEAQDTLFDAYKGVVEPWQLQVQNLLSDEALQRYTQIMKRYDFTQYEQSMVLRNRLKTELLKFSSRVVLRCFSSRFSMLEEHSNINRNGFYCFEHLYDIASALGCDFDPTLLIDELLGKAEGSTIQACRFSTLTKCYLNEQEQERVKVWSSEEKERLEALGIKSHYLRHSNFIHLNYFLNKSFNQSNKSILFRHALRDMMRQTTSNTAIRVLVVDDLDMVLHQVNDVLDDYKKSSPEIWRRLDVDLIRLGGPNHVFEHLSCVTPLNLRHAWLQLCKAERDLYLRLLNLPEASDQYLLSEIFPVKQASAHDGIWVYDLERFMSNTTGVKGLQFRAKDFPGLDGYLAEKVKSNPLFFAYYQVFLYDHEGRCVMQTKVTRETSPHTVIYLMSIESTFLADPLFVTQPSTKVRGLARCLKSGTSSTLSGTPMTESELCQYTDSRAEEGSNHNDDVSLHSSTSPNSSQWVQRPSSLAVKFRLARIMAQAATDDSPPNQEIANTRPINEVCPEHTTQEAVCPLPLFFQRGLVARSQNDDDSQQSYHHNPTDLRGQFTQRRSNQASISERTLSDDFGCQSPRNF